MRKHLIVLVLLLASTAGATCKTTSTSSTSTSTTTTTTTSTTTTTLAGALIKDLFERGTGLGDNWTTATGYGGFAIYNSSDVACATLGSACTADDNVAYWNANTLSSAESYACIRVIDGTADGDEFPGACIIDTTTWDAVCCVANLKTTDTFSMSLYNNGAYDSDAVGPTTQVFSTGDAIAIKRVDADTYSCHLQANGGTTWAALGAAYDEVDTDISISSSSFRVGITAWGSQTDSTPGTLDGIEAFEADATSTLPTGAACGAN